MVYNLEEYSKLEKEYQYPYQVKFQRQQPTLLPQADLKDLFISQDAIQSIEQLGNFKKEL